MAKHTSQSASKRARSMAYANKRRSAGWSPGGTLASSPGWRPGWSLGAPSAAQRAARASTCDGVSGGYVMVVVVTLRWLRGGGGSAASGGYLQLDGRGFVSVMAQ